MELKNMELTSASGSELNLEALYEIMPSAFTEVRDDKTGEVTHKINFNTLRELLGDNAYEGADEEYGFKWVGKNAARREAARPINKTLRPCPEESVDWEKTQNLYIEGDNLEVLKLLQKSYLGKVKMIYIDPPYNTGNDFVYRDDFAMDKDGYDRAAGNVDELGNRFRKNADGNARFHSDWCSMIYERLLVARSLLTNDGAIFISIDDNELYNLKTICDEVFGADSFINCISIKMSELSGVKMKHLKKYAKLKESLLIYAKNHNYLNLIIEKKKKSAETLSAYLKYYSQVITNINDDCTTWNIVPLNQYFSKNGITINNDGELNNWKLNNADILVYRTNSRTIDSFMRKNPNLPSICALENEDGKTIYKWDNKEMLFLNKYIEEYLGDIWMDISTINLNKETESIVFENGQKPLALLNRVIKSLEKDNMVILDFFSGSATTAHALMQLNAEDGGNRKFIMVQLPEQTEADSEANKAGYKNICEIGKERIRRAGKKIKEEAGLEAQNLDTGFRVFKCEDSFMNKVKFSPTELKQGELFSHVSNIKEGTSDLSLLFGCMLDWGVQLSLPLSSFEVGGKTIYNVNDGDLVACFAEDVNEDVITAIADLAPLRVVFRDSCFSDVPLKMNLFELFKQKCGWSEEVVKNRVHVI